MTERTGFKRKKSLRAKRRQLRLRRRIGIAVLCGGLLAALIYIGSRDRTTFKDKAAEPSWNSEQDTETANPSGTDTEISTEPEAGTEEDTQNRTQGTPVVVIDAGHGGKDQGCAYNDILEKDINLNVSLLLRDELEKEGVQVIMTREDDTFVYLNRRVSAAEEAEADAYISIHVDSYPGDSSIEGITVHYQKGAAGGKILAGDLHAVLAEAGIATVRKTMESDLYVLRNTSMPAALVEIGFLTNTSDRKNLQSEAFLEELAKELSNGIVQYLEENTQP